MICESNFLPTESWCNFFSGWILPHERGLLDSKLIVVACSDASECGRELFLVEKAQVATSRRRVAQVAEVTGKKWEKYVPSLCQSDEHDADDCPHVHLVKGADMVPLATYGMQTIHVARRNGETRAISLTTDVAMPLTAGVLLACTLHTKMGASMVTLAVCSRFRTRSPCGRDCFRVHLTEKGIERVDAEMLEDWSPVCYACGSAEHSLRACSFLAEEKRKVLRALLPPAARSPTDSFPSPRVPCAREGCPCDSFDQQKTSYCGKRCRAGEICTTRTHYKRDNPPRQPLEKERAVLEDKAGAAQAAALISLTRKVVQLHPSVYWPIQIRHSNTLLLTVQHELREFCRAVKNVSRMVVTCLMTYVGGEYVCQCPQGSVCACPRRWEVAANYSDESLLHSSKCSEQTVFGKIPNECRPKIREVFIYAHCPNALSDPNPLMPCNECDHVLKEISSNNPNGRVTLFLFEGMFHDAVTTNLIEIPLLPLPQASLSCSSTSVFFPPTPSPPLYPTVLDRLKRVVLELKRL